MPATHQHRYKEWTNKDQLAQRPIRAHGNGLSYTTFKYTGLTLPRMSLNAGDPLNLAVTVTNTGHPAGDEVVQLFLKFPNVSGAPIRALRGFPD